MIRYGWTAWLLALCACGERGARIEGEARAPDRPRAAERSTMIERQLRERGIDDPRVLAAFADVPRHELVPAAVRDWAYADQALPIGHEQTISQPFVVAAMTAALELGGDERVLEIGTGSGYQAAILSRLAREVHTIEIVEPLYERARADLRRLGYDNVHCYLGDGYRGLPELAPFDAVIVTAAPEHVPEPLIEQLQVGGKLVLPVGSAEQELVLFEKTAEGLQRRKLFDVRFVPMTGEAQER